jgi:hypothetical protein
MAQIHIIRIKLAICHHMKKNLHFQTTTFTNQEYVFHPQLHDPRTERKTVQLDRCKTPSLT